MTFWGRCTGLAAAVVATACLNDPAAPAAYRLEVRPDTIRFVALRDTLRPLILEYHGSVGPSPLFIGTYEILDTRIAIASPNGLITSRGAGTTRLVVRSPHGASDTAVVLVSQSVAHVRVQKDTLTLDALEAVLPIPVVAEDPLGSEIQDAPLQYEVADTTVVGVTQTGLVRARANGVTALTVLGGQQSATIVVRVAQQVNRITSASDTLAFTALGQMRAISVQPVDSLGHPVAHVQYHVTIADTTVLLLVDSLTVQSRSYGTSSVQIDVSGQTVTQVGVVTRVPAQIEASIVDPTGVLSLPMDSLIPIVCRVLDGDGAIMPIDPQVLPSDADRWGGSTCSTLRASRSGFDTLHIVAGSVTTTVPVVLAVRPVVVPGSVQDVLVDSLPQDVGPWAPTLVRNPAGQLEVYFAGYLPDSSDPSGFRGGLHRMVSEDGLHFRYDGLVLDRDADDCSLNGTGIENVAIVARTDGLGWRMFYASGSFRCYGWQVFSAVSNDGRTWTKEPGVRLSNGGTLPPAPSINPPWPVGEGMAVEQLPNGQLRMLVGGYRHEQNSEDKFQIVEWQSPDQLSWTYVGSVLTTDDLPAEGQGSVYSPTIREVAPGLWRMVFTADDRGVDGGRSRIWSAVSTDRQHWQLEGQLLSTEGTDYLYSTLVDEHLVFLRIPAGQPQRLATATISMP